jgi:hypothetical protein
VISENVRQRDRGVAVGNKDGESGREAAKRSRAESFQGSIEGDDVFTVDSETNRWPPAM